MNLPYQPGVSGKAQIHLRITRMDRNWQESLAWTEALQQECFVHCHTISLSLIPCIIPNLPHTGKFCLFPVLPGCHVKGFPAAQSLSPPSSPSLLRLGFATEIKELMPSCPSCCTPELPGKESAKLSLFLVDLLFPYNYQTN